MAERMLRAVEVALLLNISVPTLSNWYKFKRENPNDEYARLLPNYEVIGCHNQRFWDKSDVGALVEFKQKMPKGRSGVMGTVTQRYVKK